MLEILVFLGLSVLADESEPDAWPYAIVTTEKIVVEGNQRTKRSEVIRLSELVEGQEISRSQVIRAKKALHTSGLFSDVQVRVESGSTNVKVKVNIKVTEKTTWFLVPFFQFSSGSIGGGGAYGETNVFGLTKKFVTGGMWSNKARSAFVGYRDPSFLGSKGIIGLDGLFRSETLEEFDSNRVVVREIYLREGGFTLLPGMQWTPSFSTSIGAFFRHVKQSQKLELAGARALSEGGIRDGRDIAGVIRFDFKDLNTYEGLDDGVTTEFEAHLADDRFASKFDYSRQILRLMLAERIGEKYQWGLKANLSIQLGQRLPFYREFSAGGTNLRGYRDRQFRGDTRYSLSNEVYFPMFRFHRFIPRGVLFWDTSAIYFKDVGYKRRNWRNGIGGGLRIFLRGINFPALGYDLGYGIEEKSFNQYLNIGVAF